MAGIVARAALTAKARLAETATEVAGVIDGDGSVDLSGQRHAEDVVLPPVTGHAKVSESDGEFRIAGTIAGDAFTFVRPVTGTPPVFNGAYGFTFAHSLTGVDQSSHAVIIIDAAADGRTASIPDTAETDGEGRPLGTLSAGECRVSPRGAVSCRFDYQRADPAGPLPPGARFDAVILGGLNRFEEEMITGFGSAFATNVPPITLHVLGLTGWSATRAVAFGGVARTDVARGHETSTSSYAPYAAGSIANASPCSDSPRRRRSRLACATSR